VDDFAQFDTFSACIMINGRHDKRGGSSQNESISNESIVYKGKKEHLGWSFATTWVWEFLETCSLNPFL
jgi:hypothetical protein